MIRGGSFLRLAANHSRKRFGVGGPLFNALGSKRGLIDVFQYTPKVEGLQNRDKEFDAFANEVDESAANPYPYFRTVRLNLYIIFKHR